MAISLMFDGHDGMTWEQWRVVAAECEAAGIEALYTSDHYMSSASEELPALDAWSVIAGLAVATETLRLGTLVSPITLRHPSVLAKVVTTLDRISDGRIHVGLGTGWFAREHAAYGFALPDGRRRRELLVEQIRVLRHHWSATGALQLSTLRLDELDARPKPVQVPGPPVILGGHGGPRSLALAREHADEYNLIFATPDGCRRAAAGLASGSGDAPRLSALVGAVLADSSAAAEREARRLGERLRYPPEIAGPAGLPSSWVIGTPSELAERVADLRAAGAERVVVQIPDHERTDLIGAVAEIGREAG
jgi:alkanesulfonate monooxygenase SsuD/methylene tetrahydromethanopterin reductase-like flavin-dependent oxidoreductase (luciferase family)